MPVPESSSGLVASTWTRPSPSGGVCSAALRNPSDPTADTSIANSACPTPRSVSLLQHTTDPKAGKERMHLDLETDDVEADVRRLEQLGATRYDHQQRRGLDFWVMRDPSGERVLRAADNLPRPATPAPAMARLAAGSIVKVSRRCAGHLV